MTDIESRPATTVALDTDPLASVWARYLAAIAMTAAAAIVAIAVDSKVHIPNLSLVFVIPVIIAGVGLGLGPSLCAAVVGALSFNFFLTEPRYSLVVDDPSNIWAIGLLFVVGLIASGVAFTSRRRAEDAKLLRMRATIVQRYSRDVAAADNIIRSFQSRPGPSRLYSERRRWRCSSRMTRSFTSSEPVTWNRRKRSLARRGRPW